jgi:dephospho-CoA kinase
MHDSVRRSSALCVALLLALAPGSGRARQKPSVVGITGGIASGKSTVSRMFQQLGAVVVDADVLARKVVQPGRVAHRDIVRTFGKQVLAPDGTINRKLLGKMVFSDPAKLQTLNRIVHPRLAAQARREFAKLGRAGERLVFYDAALLVEKGWHRKLDSLVVVSVPESVQLQRVMRRDGLNEEAARARIRSQLPLSAKLAAADHVIDNSGSLDQTRQQVQRLWHKLQTQLSASGAGQARRQ